MSRTYSATCLKNQKIPTMDYREMMMGAAPLDCRPTMVDNQKEIERIRAERAKALGKEVSELTEAEMEVSLSELGLCPLDFLD